MVIVSIQGGLGNQMFQYAAGRALALRLGVELKLDLSWYDSISENVTPRSFMLDAFLNIDVPRVTKKEVQHLSYTPYGFFDRLLQRPKRYACSYVAEPHFNYWKGFEKVISPAYLSGYWQNELYFVAFSETLKQDFTFPPLKDRKAEEMALHIRTSRHAVAVHVRRGDYASNASAFQCHGLCSQEYYNKALDAITAQLGTIPELFIFSDDPVWVREHFDTQNIPSTILDFPKHIVSPWHDMHLMTLCKHHIIANSSFSWWGAWLSNKGIICAPKRWFISDDLKNQNPCPKNWLLLG